MTTPILTTKLYIPRPQPGAVVRPRLLDHLDGGLYGKLTLVSAPAGFGKTTLVTAWVASLKRPVAWVSLDASDSDPGRFLAYVVAALQTVAPGLGDGLLKALQQPSPPIPTLLPPLLNEIAAMSQDVVLVLDDYHLIDNQAVDSALNFLVEHQPPGMHLVITTREDPPLPLARLRARGQMTEVRAVDLRFTTDEAAAFLRDGMGVEVGTEAIEALEARTEGWAVGLQLAALSLRGGTNPADFAQSFSGTHHFVLDYLTEEVLHGQSATVQRFLLWTSILDQFCAPLCDALLADTAVNGAATLQALHESNLFLVPLDNERRWYRYHHLFRDLLRQRLQGATEIEVNTLHRRASAWYEANGYPLEAFEHAAAANDLEGAARLIEGEGTPLYYRGGATPVLHWLETLSPATLAAHPALLVHYAAVQMTTGTQVHTIEDKLQSAETALQASPEDAVTRNLLGHIAAIRALLAGPLYAIDTILAQSQRALDYLPPENLAIRTMALWAKGMAHQYQGQREAAREVYTEVITASEPSNNVMMTIAALTCIGQLQVADNQLHLAEPSFQRVLDIIGEPPWPTTCEAQLGLARIYYQQNDLERATHHAQLAHDLSQQVENLDTPVAALALLAEIQLAQGANDEAATTLTTAERFAHQRGYERQLPLVATAQVRLLLRQGQVDTAAHLANQYELPLSKVRVLLAEENPAAALDTLRAYLADAEAQAWPDKRLRALVLMAVAHHAADDLQAALEALSEALTLAGPGNMVRVFLDAEDALGPLLDEAIARGVHPSQTTHLLDAHRAEFPQSGVLSNQPLIDPLTDRELEILRWVAAGLSNREIGERLYLALDTVKGHNRRIYAKLGVSRRTEAVARARELNLL